MNRSCIRLAVLAPFVPGGAGAVDEEAGGAKPATPARNRGLVELKRHSTDGGTAEETTKTNLKFDYFPREGAVPLFRLELPFPDEKTTFAGSPFDPDFGDAKIRLGLRAIDFSIGPVTSFVELTFPTAEPASQGTGKYQFSAGVRTAMRMAPGTASFGSPAQSLAIQVQQVVSFSGDPARKDINQTKFELEWRDTWVGEHYAKATAKPVVDWIGAVQTGAVLELEGGWVLDPRWKLALMAGHLMWGEGVSGTYKTRAEIKVIYRY